ncbi:MAG TPA: class I SAM-dependent methyltransferase [Dehalococcoidia bacterium]|nr:class I SAM-dependent methyltransferase [Dehalococcoidia bacterium]
MAEMSAVERWLVNSPVRAWLQRAEIRAFLRWSGIGPDAAVLDMGCGSGVSTALIRSMARPRRLDAFDFDPKMAARASRRLRRRDSGTPVSVLVADASRMPFRAGAFDAVFETGVLHHVPDWRRSLREVRRVLRPGGRFCFAEPSRGRLQRGLYRALPHATESMFDADEWRAALEDAGLRLLGPLRRLPMWDVCGVAKPT